MVVCSNVESWCRILVTGAAGNVGREVVASAKRSGLEVTAAVRSPERSSRLFPDTKQVTFDFNDPKTWAEALEGHNLLFLVRPPAIADVQRNLNPFIDQAYQMDVQHVVFLSVAGADRNLFVPHAKVEKHLASYGNKYTSLRPGFFAQNLQDAYLNDIFEDNRIILPAGNAEVNWIDARDVADVATLVFRDPEEHRGKSYALTGPGSVPWDHVMKVLSEVCNRTIKYEPASVLKYILHLRERNLRVGQIAVQTILHTPAKIRTGGPLRSYIGTAAR